MLRLFLIDEVHMLKEESRGATLEVVVSRMKTVSKALHQGSNSKSIRILAMSATVPNVQDIAFWLCQDNGSQAVVREFGEEYRPVKLEKLVLAFPQSGNEYMFEKFLDAKLMEVIQSYSSGKPTLVFCSTKKSTITAAEVVARQARESAKGSPWGFGHPFVKTKNQHDALMSLKSKFKDRKLSGKLDPIKFFSLAHLTLIF
jgi:ATP-dependent DNA helicase HFM1/MER3